MMLPVERESVFHDEIGVIAAKAPDDCAIFAGDLVDGARVASRDEEVALGVLVNGVDLEMGS